MRVERGQAKGGRWLLIGGVGVGGPSKREAEPQPLEDGEREAKERGRRSWLIDRPG